MSDDQAAHVAQMATQAAEALTKVAAAEAASVVEVAAAAHANLAPSVLVVSMFETLQRQIEVVAKELADGRRWMAAATEAHQKVATGLEGLRANVAVQNGGVTRALNWMASHDARMAAEADIASGRKAQRADDLAVVRGLRTFATEFWPLILGAVLGGIGVGSFLWGYI